MFLSQYLPMHKHVQKSNKNNLSTGGKQVFCHDSSYFLRLWLLIGFLYPIYGWSICLSFAIGCWFSVSFLVEISKHYEEDDSIGTNPIRKSHWIVTLDEEQLWCVQTNQDKLNLKVIMTGYILIRYKPLLNRNYIKIASGLLHSWFHFRK